MFGVDEGERPVDTGERWKVSGASTAARLGAWSEILAETHVGFDVRPTWRTPERFQGAVSRRRVGDLMLLDCTASPFLGHRGASMSRGEPEQHKRESVLGFQFVAKGVELVREGARELAVSSGDVVLWDGLAPTEVEIVESFYKRTLLFPRDRVLALCPRLAERDAFPALDGSGPARLLVRYMNALAAELPRLDAAARAGAAEAALELLRAAVEPALPTGRHAARTAMRAEIRRYVRTQLQDPALGPGSIARTYAMSVRALHALFHDADESVAELVRRERLARCMEDLRRPDGGSVTEIAFRWGFSDGAHFSRVFKRWFGVTPSEARAEGAEAEGIG
jgi:AraC family transcriptional regulator, positive regulator of tynA and feaB